MKGPNWLFMQLDIYIMYEYVYATIVRNVKKFVFLSNYFWEKHKT